MLTGFNLGPNANLNYRETSILKQVYDRIHQRDCKAFIELELTKNNVSKDLNTLDKPLNKAVLNKWHSGLTPQNVGISQDRFGTIQQNFAETRAAAVTLSDRTRIYLADTIFLREGNDSMFNIFSSHKDIDTASHLVHELFHIAGIDHAESFAFDEQI